MRDYGAEQEIYDGLASLVKKVGVGLWPFTPFTELVDEVESDMKTTYDLPDPNYSDPPEPKRVPVCSTCGSDNVSFDPKFCFECESYRDMTDEDSYLKAHPEDVLPQEDSGL